MLPTLRQRLIITVTTVFSSVVWLSLWRFLRPTDGSTGLTLTSAWIGLPLAVMMIIAVGLLVMVLSLVASSTGHPLAGVFTASAALCVLASKGGAVDGWMHRSSLPGDYALLLLEVLLWQLGLMGLMTVIKFFRVIIRKRWPGVVFNPGEVADPQQRLSRRSTVGAAVVCGLIGGLLGCLLILSDDGKQVIGALILAFGVGALIAQVIFPQAYPTGILLSPAVVAVVSYAYMLLRFETMEQVLEAWYNRQMPAMAMALPIHYASAAVVGCVIGIGIAQGSNAVKSRLLSATT